MGLGQSTRGVLLQQKTYIIVVLNCIIADSFFLSKHKKHYGGVDGSLNVSFAICIEGRK